MARFVLGGKLPLFLVLMIGKAKGKCEAQQWRYISDACSTNLRGNARASMPSETLSESPEWISRGWHQCQSLLMKGIRSSCKTCYILSFLRQISKYIPPRYQLLRLSIQSQSRQSIENTDPPITTTLWNASPSITSTIFSTSFQNFVLHDQWE